MRAGAALPFAEHFELRTQSGNTGALEDLLPAKRFLQDLARDRRVVGKCRRVSGVIP
jgi:hypothetical protein